MRHQHLELLRLTPPVASRMLLAGCLHHRPGARAQERREARKHSTACWPSY